jgi:hypothetical protein
MEHEMRKHIDTFKNYLNENEIGDLNFEKERVVFTPEQYEEVGKAIKENMMVDIAMLAQLKPAAINQQLVVLLYMKHTPGFNPQEQLDTYFQQQA